MASAKYETGTLTTMLSTELNSLASNSRAISTTPFDNGDTANLYFSAYFEAVLDYASAPTADLPFDVYIVPAIDGTNYANGDASIAPPGTLFAGSFALRAVNTAQRLVFGPVTLPPETFHVVVHNRGGQALDASGNTIKMLPVRQQVG